MRQIGDTTFCRYKKIMRKSKGEHNMEKALEIVGNGSSEGVRNYHTQMEAAKKGIITEQMKIVAKKEYRTEEEIRNLVAKGQVVICANRQGKHAS